jgi:hypothetical protein
VKGGEEGEFRRRGKRMKREQGRRTSREGEEEDGRGGGGWR